MVTAIIPARGGSKRIPKKNTKLFVGRPVIEYSIATAQKSGLFDRIIVSTDSEEIASIARAAGAEVPFMRPPELADDHATTAVVLEHALNWLSGAGVEPDYFCCIYATAPLIRQQYLKDGFELLTRKKVGAVVPVTTFDYPIFRALKISPTGHLEMFWPEHELTRSNDLPAAYHDAGQFYWLDAKAFRKVRKLYTQDALPIVLPRHLVQDIDTFEDWEMAETIYRNLKND